MVFICNVFVIIKCYYNKLLAIEAESMSRLLLFLCFFSAVFCEPEEEPYTPVPTQPKAALNLTECDVCQILAEEMFRQVLMTV